MSDPLTDPLRLAALERTGLLDTPPEEVFDRLTGLASRLLGTEVSLMSLVDAERQFFKSRVGREDSGTPLAASFCQYVVSDAAPLVVPDARRDPRLRDNESTLDGSVIAYAGVPLTDGDGHVLGSFCAASRSPREWTADEIEVLRELATSAMTELRLRAANAALAVREAEARVMAQVVAGISHAVVTISRDGTITSWNGGAERLYGVPAQEMIGTRYDGELDEGGAGRSGSAPDGVIERCLRGEHLRAARLPRRRRDGSTVHVDLSCSPLRDGRGEIVGVTTVAIDVSEQFRLEQRLVSSEQRLRQTFDEAPIGIALVSPEGRWLQVNRALCDILGYSPEELLGLTFQEITHPADLDADLELVRQVLAGEIETYQMEKRFRHRRGHHVPIKLSVALVRDAEGAPLHFVAHVEDISRAWETAAALRENTRMLDESQRVAGLGSWGWNLETGEPSWSAQQFVLFGFPPEGRIPSVEELLARVHPDDRARLADNLTSQVLDRRSFVDECRVEVPGGGLRTLLIRGDFLDADPALELPARVAGLTQDVTAEREADAARRAAEMRNQVLLSSLPDTVVTLFDHDLRCQLIEGATAELGIEPSAFAGRLLSEYLPPAQFEALAPIVRRAIAGRRESLEYTTADGHTYHVDAVPYQTEADGILGAFTVWRDITRVLERERQTRMLATIVQQSDDAIIAKDRSGVITEWNRGAETLYGYRAEEVIGRPVAMLVPPDRAGEDLRLLARILTGDSIAQYETIRVRKDGSHVPVSISVSPLNDAAGTIVGASIIARDITQRREAEAELRASREQALEASRLKSEFVANMSHEIRTPLNGVVSMIELLRETEVTVEQREYADVALTSAEALMRVINDILDFSKIEAGKLEIVNEDFDLRDAVEEVCDIVGIKALERGVEMRIATDPSIAGVVRGDANRVRQVLMNLLSNAVKFTAHGHISVTVVPSLGPRGERRVCLEVADTGIGIDPERLAALFEPFSQEDATTTRRYGGTGLGLCISKQLVELMGGEIGCESEPGRGSRFWFSVPYVPGVAAEADPRRSDLTGTRILIVDSLADQREMLARHLANWGVSPDMAADGLTALGMLRRAADTGRPYEAALIGRTVPERDELELARSITSVPALRATRLLLVTASAVDPAVARAAGIEDQILKPLRQSRLYNQLVATIYRARTASAGVPSAPAPEARPDPIGARVLVVDDNEVNRFAAIRLLQTLGLNVDVATDGREAITMSGRRNYAAIFMDCQMPNVDGYTASRMIRKRERGSRRTPIIALTAHALEGDREKCLAAGMDDYIAKPLRLATIEALIQRLPSLRQAGPSTTTVAPAASADPVFDPTHLSEIGDPETEAALAMMFLDQATERIPALLEAIEAPDHDRLHSLAHGLKGSAATVGAHRISQLARTLCELAESAREDDGAGSAGSPGGSSTPPAPAVAVISPRAAEVHTQLAHALNQTRSALDTYVARSSESA